MTTNPTGPEMYLRSRTTLRESGDEYDVGYAHTEAVQAQTAALVMLTEVIANATGTDHYDLDTWREVIPGVPLKECRAKEIRRPECADRHTDDCEYTDPVPEPKHELLPVGTKVLVSDPHDCRCECANIQPWVGKIAGYDLHKSKYQVNEERHYDPGEYYDHVRWVFADNRVQSLDEQPAPEKSDPATLLTSLLSRFEKTWDCEVSRTGYHNNSTCDPKDPHVGRWSCGYVWKFPLLTDKGAREIGLLTDSTKDDG